MQFFVAQKCFEADFSKKNRHIWNSTREQYLKKMNENKIDVSGQLTRWYFFLYIYGLKNASYKFSGRQNGIQFLARDMRYISYFSSFNYLRNSRFFFNSTKLSTTKISIVIITTINYPKQIIK